MLISRSGAGVARRAHNPKVGSSNLSSATKRNSSTERCCCFFFDSEKISNCRPEGSRGNACDRRLWRRKGARVGAAVEKIEEKRSPKIFSGTARGQRKSEGFPAISSSNLSSATKRNSNADRRCCFFFDFRITSNYRSEGSRGNACDRRLWRRKGARVGAAVEKIEEKRSPKIFSGTARGQRKSEGFPAISSSNLSSATKRNLLY